MFFFLCLVATKSIQAALVACMGKQIRDASEYVYIQPLRERRNHRNQPRLAADDCLRRRAQTGNRAMKARWRITQNVDPDNIL